MRIFLLLAAMMMASSAQNDCSLGACYPPSRDLLLGRSHLLHASSTCGLDASEIYCTPYYQSRMKCCPCDSRNTDSQLAHTVQNILTSSKPDRWWQSKKGVNHVTLQLDLGNLFQLDSLVLSFKGPRPSALVIEKSLDHSRTWQPVLYLAANCQKSFPVVPTSAPLTLDGTYCHTLPHHANHYQNEKIDFSPLHQYALVPASKSQKLEEKSALTGLRVNLTELGDVPHIPGRTLSRFYALNEMKVMGACMCHGHANRCLPEEDNDPGSNRIQVNSQCDCKHNTAGVNCERCADLYNDLPWKPAEERNTHACKRCECNNHAQHCHFSQAVYEASGKTSGGVCDGCLHHTVGPKCDQCAPGYQPNPRSRMDRPDACIRCSCSPEGTASEGQCMEPCQCKVNVEGSLCDRCKRGSYGMSRLNPAGCSKCSCSPDGSLSDICDLLTGQCPCRPNFLGLTCDVCSKGYWKSLLSKRCEPCGCEPISSNSDSCDQLTGQCQCRPGFGGRKCTECPDNMYGNPWTGCQLCRCDAVGTVPGGCDKQTGECFCRHGVTGPRCDTCSRGHCASFPACELCPSCFFTLDSQRMNISLALETLFSRFPDVPGGPENFGNLEASVNLIKSSISPSPSTIRQLSGALVQLNKLRDELGRVDSKVPPTLKTPDLESELDELQALFDRLVLMYETKRSASGGSSGTFNTGAFSAIKTAYKDSTDAAKKVNATEDIVKNASDLREQTSNVWERVQPGNTRDLKGLNSSMASQPDLIPAAKQVCGSVRSDVCSPFRCEGGPLCPPERDQRCEKGAECIGALPLGNRANTDVTVVKDQLDKLGKKITEAAAQLQKTQKTTNQVRQSAKDLSSKIKQTRNELEKDLEEMSNTVKELKNFLSDPSSNLTQIQEVSDWILKAKLPLGLSELYVKIGELKNLSADLTNSTHVLKEAEPQLDTARRLLQDARDVRDQALRAKADVSQLQTDLDTTNGSIYDLEKKLQDSLDMIGDLNKTLTQTKGQLSPTEEALVDVSSLIKPLKPLLEELKELLKNGPQQAQDAQKDAGRAEDAAAAAAQRPS
nr:laminin subunit beta-3 isoform X2 [Nothobranchius furzeri]